jgi:hypothetical protein
MRRVDQLSRTVGCAGVVAMIMLRTLRRDISNYNEMQTLVGAQSQRFLAKTRLKRGRDGDAPAGGGPGGERLEAGAR